MRGLTFFQEQENPEDDPFEANEEGERTEHRDAYGGEVNALAMYLRELGKAPLLTGEREILWLRFGIGEPTSYTSKEVGQRFGISRERVRQIERKALKKLRAEPRARIMYSLLICAR